MCRDVCIVLQTKLSQRVHMMSQFVDLAETLRNLNNYQLSACARVCFCACCVWVLTSHADR
jgi:hypothetical protein